MAERTTVPLTPIWFNPVTLTLTTNYLTLNATTSSKRMRWTPQTLHNHSHWTNTTTHMALTPVLPHDNATVRALLVDSDNAPMT